MVLWDKFDIIEVGIIIPVLYKCIMLEQRKSNRKVSHGFEAVIHIAARVLMILGI